MLHRLNRHLSELSPAEQKVADAIIADPEWAVEATTAQLAQRAGVSDPMVSRTCRRLGCDSFPALKLELARGLATGGGQVTGAVAAGDKPADYIAKRVAANIGALEYLHRELPPADIERAVTLLRDARRIDIYGMGGSAAIAQDAWHKLFRLGIPVQPYSDNLMQRMSAATADAGTVVMAISFTGRTQMMLEAATEAKRQGAAIIALTRLGSPLASMADVAITSGDELEDTTLYVPMTTRTLVLTVIDILTTGLALALGDSAEPRLQAIKASLESTKRPA